MNEKQLRNLLLQHPLPDEFTAEERAWDVVRGAFTSREPVKRSRHVPWRALVVVALVGAAVAVGVSPAGSTIATWVRDKVGTEKVVGLPARPALVKLPASGRVLVVSPNGVWAVSQDGGRRFLGRYKGATWSPSGRFVAAWDGKQVVALDPNVTNGLHWSRPAPDVLGARWSPSGFRVAYVTGQTLHVVVGNNTGERTVATDVAPVLPAWRPGKDEVLAYSDGSGRLVAVNADTRKKLLRTPRAPAPIALEWTDDGQQLAALGPQRLRMFSDSGKLVAAEDIPEADGVGTSMAVRPGSHQVAYTIYSPVSGRSTVFLFDGKSSRQLFVGAGRLNDLAWSPDGRYLLVPWRAADQLLFIPAGKGRVLATAGIANQFSPGRQAGAAFPRVDGWCCTPAFSSS